MKKVNILISAFIPSEVLTNVEASRRSRFFVTSCFITALFAFGYYFMSLYIKGTYFADAMVVSVLLFLALPALLKKGVPLSFLENIFVADIVVVVVLLIYWEGGIRNANTAPWPLVVPIFALLMQGPRKAVKWLIISLAIIFAFSWFTFQGIRFPVRFDTSKDPLFNVLSLSGLVCIVTTIFYISENQKRQAQNELKKQNRQLENLNNEKDNFLRIVSHDLKSPVLIVTEFAKYLSEPDLTEEEKTEYLGHIISSGDRMLELIRNLLDINIIESGKMVVKRKRISVNDLITKYIDQVSLLALNKHIKLHAVMPDKAIELESDKSRLEQVLDNYVSNAMKYCQEGKNVYIQLIESATYIEMSVRDEGPGIDKAEQDRLFVQFSTVSSVPRAGYHSSGLGLAIVKKIADSLGATVGCISEAGEGCTFYIRFPKAADAII
ncbi:MAG: integral rane sensor signal transduction histidine kinase [Bacteroidetes bacterium]|nr:integral rane sensor signal transduction histidine kinase [Bacteroidota bacterium]